jgi:DivIVA domain-containing protein
MTPEDVRTVAFRKPPIGKRGYDEEQVDDVLARVEATLRGGAQITRDELNAVSFRRPPLGRRGYRAEEVDTFVQRVLAEWPAG